MRSANNGSNQDVVSPALVQPEAGGSPTPDSSMAAIAKSGSDAAPVLGSPAPSTAPERMISKDDLDAIIKARVDEQVTAKLAALEMEDPTKEALTQEDQQFARFEKKLEVFGVDLAKVMPGFTLHWFNDDGDRIPRMEAMGWAFVSRKDVALNERTAPLNQDLGDNVAVYVGTREGGAPMRAFLMKLPTDLYERRYNRAQEHNDMIDEAIRRGGIGPALQQRGYLGTDRDTVKIEYDGRQKRIARSQPS